MCKNEKTVGLLISSFLPNLGGIEVGLHNIALRVGNLGWKPIVFAPYEHARILKKEGWDLPYKVIAIPPKSWGTITRMPSIGFKIMDLYLGYMQKKYNIDFWHVTMGYPMGCAMVHYAKNSKKNVQYLIRCAGEDIQKKPEIGYGFRLDPEFDRIISYYLGQAQRLVAITPSVYKEYKNISVPDDKIYNIPNGVAVNRFEQDVNRNKVRKKYGVDKNDILILSVGRNHPKKNYETLIRSGVHLKEYNLHNFKIVCIGNNCSKLADQVSKLELSNHVILIDGMSKPNKSNILLPVDELIEIYKSADIFAFPSIIETFGIAIVEAMAAGLPVIVGDSEGCRDIVEHGKWGMMFNPNCPKELAKKIINVISDTKLQDSMIKKSYKRAQDFSWDNIAQKYVDIYEEVKP